MTNFPIDNQMTAVVLDSYSGVDAIRIEHRPIPTPGNNEVLVKIAAASINPSDLSFLDGLYGFKKPTPVVPGFEGSGIVIATGSGMMARYLMGKRVACISQDKGDGVWAEYMVTSTDYALPLSDAVSFDQGAMSIVNPLTAIALISIAKKGKHKAIINTAAASALGQMLNRLGKSEGIRVVNVVRREAQVTLLKQQGAEIVLNSSEPDFAEQLKATCHQYKVRLAFDAIAGPSPMQLLDAMPKYSKVTVYGGLSLQLSEINPGLLIFQNKSIDGFWLTAWLRHNNFAQNYLIWRRAQKLMAAELKTEVRAKYTFADAVQGIKAYQNEMTGGKVLLTP